MLDDEGANCLEIVAPDRIREAAGEYESRPAGDAVAAGEHVLRVGELGVACVYVFGMMRTQGRDCRGVAITNRAEKVLGLVSQLLQVGSNGQVTIGHDEPPSEMPAVRQRRAHRRFV
jgi:hypothetical protein